MTTLKVELLKGQDNYQLWFIRMKGVLQGQSLWTYLTGDRKEPSKKENEDDEDFSDRMDKYWQNCHKARGLIIQTVSNEILLNLEHIESAKECWDYLQEQYKPTGMAFAHAKFLEWDTLCFDGKDIQHYCNAYKATCSNLKEAQEELSNSLKLHRFIHQISPYYNAFCTGLRQDMRKIRHHHGSSGSPRKVKAWRPKWPRRETWGQLGRQAPSFGATQANIGVHVVHREDLHGSSRLSVENISKSRIVYVIGTQARQ